MNKLREHTGVILWILVISFGIIWVLQDSGAFDVVGNVTGTNIIYVDGEPITYEEYSRALDAQLQQYQTQTGEAMPPQMVDLERDRVFNALVENKLLEREMDRLGIEVTDEEVYNMVLGERPHPVIGMYFNDGKGGVNRTLLQNFVDDPEARDEWIQLETYLRTERRREKLQNLIGATVRVSDQDVQNEYLKRHRSVDARYVALRYADVPDAQITLTDADIRAFYDENKKDFERKKTYTVNYVVRSKEATAADSALIKSELQRVKERFAAAEDDSLFLAQNGSERPYSGQFFSAAELDPALANLIFPNPNAGALLGPVMAGNEGHLVKVKAVQPAAQPSLSAQHILITAPENDPAARAQALARVNELKQQLAAGANFSDLARQYSQDPGSAAQGGSLGWFGKGRMVEAFEAAAFGAPVGQVVGPVATQYGYHLIRVLNKATQEVRLADYALRVRPDVGTLTAIEEQLDDLQYYAAESNNFKAEAERRKLPVQTVQIEEKQDFIPGIGNSRALMNFLAEAETGAVSEVIELNNQFIVAHLQEVKPAGFRSFEEVKAELEPRVRIAKKKEIVAKRLQDALQKGGSLEAVAGAVGTAVGDAQQITFNNPVAPGLGREIKFTGTALGLKAGQTSRVVEGENAAYIVQTVRVNEPAPLTDGAREQIRNELLGQRRSTVLSQWLASLREKAEVEDHRARFQQ